MWPGEVADLEHVTKRNWADEIWLPKEFVSNKPHRTLEIRTLLLYAFEAVNYSTCWNVTMTTLCFQDHGFVRLRYLLQKRGFSLKFFNVVQATHMILQWLHEVYYHVPVMLLLLMNFPRVVYIIFNFENH